MTAPAVPARALATAAEGQVSAQSVSKRTALDAAASDHYGMHVAVSGEAVVVGAPGDDTVAGVDAGSVYAYERDGDAWIYDAKLTAGDASANALFGDAVAVYDKTMVVGAHGEATMRGAVYVFTESGGVWTQQQKIVPAGSADMDHVGISVALYRDTLVIGTWADVAYVYTRTGTTWSLQGTLVDPGGVAGDMFGLDVALYRDTALVSAGYDDGFRGSAVVFTRSGTTWAYQAKLTASDRAVNDYFGSSVALDRDTALVGAVGDDDHGASSGSAYVFTRSGSTWTQAAKLAPADGAADDAFGAAASIWGETAVIGAGGDDTGAGAAYLYSRASGTWQGGRMVASDRVANDRYGASVAVCGDMIVVGAPFDDDVPIIDMGSVYLNVMTPPAAMGLTRLAGPNRYLTAARCSHDAFWFGASAVVIATGENWPDALGGSALAGAVRGPILLTPKASLPADVIAEIVRLGARRVYILGGTGAVSAAVENQLVTLMGRPDVIRLAGDTRYQTAEIVARTAIDHVGSAWERRVFVATGADFPDATAASPVSAYFVMPVLLADPRSTHVYRPPMALDAYILGGTAAVPAATEAALVSQYGAGHVTRYAGDNRYETAVLVAEAATVHDLAWPGFGLASGMAFPDALAAGPFLAMRGSPMLLTDPNRLSPATRAEIESHEALIGHVMFIVGGTAAISPAVEMEARHAAGMP